MKRSLYLCLSLLNSALVFGQVGEMPLTGLGQNSALPKLFGIHKSFSARAEASAKDGLVMPIDLAMRDGKMRMEVDMGKVKSKEITPESSAIMNQLGLSKMVLVSLPEQKVVRYIFPGLKGYSEMAVTGGKEGAEPKIEVKEAGKETVDGHLCIKNTVTFVEANGDRTEATTWNAEDLKQFPVKLEVPSEKGRTTMLFRDVKLTPPDAKLFEAPEGYKKHADMQQMIMSAVGGLK